MDMSSLNPAEQAHMTKIIEKKQVRALLNFTEGNILMNAVLLDARLPENVL